MAFNVMILILKLAHCNYDSYSRVSSKKLHNCKKNHSNFCIKTM